MSISPEFREELVQALQSTNNQISDFHRAIGVASARKADLEAVLGEFPDDAPEEVVEEVVEEEVVVVDEQPVDEPVADEAGPVDDAPDDEPTSEAPIAGLVEESESYPEPGSEADEDADQAPAAQDETPASPAAQDGHVSDTEDDTER